MNKCKDCRFWDKNNYGDSNSYLCLQIKNDILIENESYYPGFNPNVYTNKDFGCVLWESKEDEKK